MSFRRLITGSVVALPLTLGLVACGSDPDASTDSLAGGESSAVGESPAGELNDADIEFAQGMIAHHEQAIEMSEIALDPNRGASEAVTDLARRIQSAQEPEVEQMTAVLVAAGESIAMDMSDGHDMSAMPGMMSADEMDALAELTGADFDRVWLEMMIAHHEGAIEQASAVTENGSNADLIALAAEITTTQQAEIDEMKALLAG
jgi:uncharacterized protein (DUF305 family)